METDKLITVVVPVRNRADIVLRTLDSLATQTHSHFHIIVVDNGSTDSTVAKVESWAKNRTGLEPTIEILHCSEVGAPAARNAGLDGVATPWVMFFDSDDEMRPQHLANIVKEIKAFPDCELLYFDATMMDEDGWCHPKRVEDKNVMRGHLFHCSLSTQRMAIRTELVRKVGGWQKECAIWDDFELGVRLLLATTEVRKLHGDPQVVIHPHSADSVTGICYRDRLGLHEKSLNIIDSHFNSPEHSLPHIWIECRRMILAAMYAREGEKEIASRLRGEVLERHNGKTSMKLRAIYAAQRLTGHGGSTLSIRLFKSPSMR